VDEHAASFLVSVLLFQDEVLLEISSMLQNFAEKA